MFEKLHKGKITDWIMVPFGTEGRRLVYGTALDHPLFAGKHIRTSYIVSHDEATGEIETRNSRYTLVGKECR